MQCSIIMPVWNKSDLTHRFLSQHHAFMQMYSDVEYELIVVNNGSTDITGIVLDDWKDKIPQLKVIDSPENLGFGGGNNLGVKYATGDVLIFTQNDILIHGDYISPLVAGAMNSKQSLCGPTLRNFDTGWNKFGRYVAHYLEGWCLACYKATWLEIGGFDERYYPCDFEDVDLSEAFIRDGKQLTVISTPLSHIGHGTAGLSDARRNITLKHKAKFAEKWGYVEG